MKEIQSSQLRYVTGADLNTGGDTQSLVSKENILFASRVAGVAGFFYGGYKGVNYAFVSNQPIDVLVLGPLGSAVGYAAGYIATKLSLSHVFQV